MNFQISKATLTVFIVLLIVAVFTFFVSGLIFGKKIKQRIVLATLAAIIGTILGATAELACYFLPSYAPTLTIDKDLLTDVLAVAKEKFFFFFFSLIASVIILFVFYAIKMKRFRNLVPW